MRAIWGTGFVGSVKIDSPTPEGHLPADLPTTTLLPTYLPTYLPYLPSPEDEAVSDCCSTCSGESRPMGL